MVAGNISRFKVSGNFVIDDVPADSSEEAITWVKKFTEHCGLEVTVSEVAPVKDWHKVRD